MTHRVTLIPGDGIGPEVMQATVRILEATGVKFDWEIFQVGAEAFAKYNEYIPKELIESIERTRVGLKGPVTTPVGGFDAPTAAELGTLGKAAFGTPPGGAVVDKAFSLSITQLAAGKTLSFAFEPLAANSFFVPAQPKRPGKSALPPLHRPVPSYPKTFRKRSAHPSHRHR